MVIQIKKGLSIYLSIILVLVLLLLFFLTPVDPAGPDCYQSGTKPCEST
jgi:hypothetical protein